MANKVNVPSCRGMEHKLDGTGNYLRYSENLATLFNEDGIMKQGEPEKPKHNLNCSECSVRDTLCGTVVLKGSFDCRGRLGLNEE